MKVIILVLFILFLVILGPILSIWSLNTLFPALAIPYTVETWFASLILSSVFASKIKS